jgi:hypothetical protein
MLDVEQDADFVMFVFREERFGNLARDYRVTPYGR